MLPITESMMAKIGQLLDYGDEDKITYTVRNGDVWVSDDSVWLYVSNYSPLDNGCFEFLGGDTQLSGDRLISHWYDYPAKAKRKMSVPLNLLKQVHSTIAGGLAKNPDKEYNPTVFFSIKPVKNDLNYKLITVQIKGNQKPENVNNCGGTTFEYHMYHPHDHDLNFRVDAQDLLNWLSFFVPLKAKQRDLYVDLFYTQDDPKRFTIEPIILSLHLSGHHVMTGLFIDKPGETKWVGDDLREKILDEMEKTEAKAKNPIAGEKIKAKAKGKTASQLALFPSVGSKPVK